jgi:hypothetical protein
MTENPLEAEGDIAADYLEGLLDIIDVDGDLEMDVENGRAMVAIVGRISTTWWVTTVRCSMPCRTSLGWR